MPNGLFAVSAAFLGFIILSMPVTIYKQWVKRRRDRAEYSQQQKKREGV